MAAFNLFEKILELNKLPLKSADNKLKEIKSLSEEAFSKFQEESKWAVVKHHFENNDFYRNFLGNKFPADWNDIPVINKPDFQHPIETLLAKPFKPEDVYISNTSGSSGHPFFFAKDRFTHALTWAVIKDRYSRHGIKLGAKQARFYGIPLNGIGLYKEKLKDWLANRVRFPVFDLSDVTLQKFLKKFYSVKFEYIYGYTSSLVIFAKFLIENNIVLSQVNKTLKVCLVTSEVLTKEDRVTLEKGFGIPVVNEYGASELDLIAFEDEDFDWITTDETLFIEILDENNKPLPQGQEGKLVITSLFNRAMPFIRYQIGDFGMLETSKKGNNHILKMLSGRVNDFAILPSGKRSPGLTFYYISKSLMEEGGVMKEFIIKQKAPDTFEFEYVAKRALNDNEKAQVQKMMDLYLEPGLKPVFTKKEQIDRPASGKIKHFYCEI